MNISREQARINYVHSATVDIPRVKIEKPHNRKFIGIGSGPSIVQYKEEIKGIVKDPHSEADAFFTKSGHDYLHREGIHGSCVLLDGRQRSAEEFFKPTYLNHYYMCSHCHPKMFNLLEGQYKWLFHVTKEPEILETFKPDVGVTILGGSTSVGRMIGLGITLGYREFLFVGTDCSYDLEVEPVHDYLKTPTPPGTKIVSLIVECKGRTFLTNGAFIQQLRDFDKMLQKLQGINVRFLGDGLMQWRYQNIEDGAAPNILVHKAYTKKEE